MNRIRRTIVSRALPAFFLVMCALPRCGLAAETLQPSWTSYAYPPAFTHFGTADGLSQNTVYATLQDKEGFLWFGTENGLNRYDGFHFKVFHPDKNNPSESLSSEWINCLFEDSRGTLWIGTNGGGLARYDRDRQKFRSFFFAPKNGDPAPNNIIAIEEDRDKNLWFGTGKGLYMLSAQSAASRDPQFRMFNPFSASADSAGIIGSLYLDKEGALWIGSNDHGMARLGETGDTAHFNFERILADTSQGGSASPPDVVGIAEDLHGVLWLGSFGGVYSYTRATHEFHHYPHRDDDPWSLGIDLIRRMYRDRAGDMWIATDGGGLYKMLPRAKPEDPPRFQHIQHDNKNPSSLSSNAIESIYEDRSNVLWLGSYFMGLNKMIFNNGNVKAREKRPLLQYRNVPGDTTSLSGNMVNAMAEDKFGNLWVGTDGSGLNRVLRPKDPSEPLKFEHFRADSKNPRAFPEDVVTGLFIDSEKELWAVTYTAGLVKIDVGTPSAKPVFTVYKHDGKNKSSLSSNFNWMVFEDHAKRLWIGSDGGGLDLLDRKTQSFKHFGRPGRNPSEYSEDAIYSILEDKYGTLWLATVLGLVRFNVETGVFKTYYQSEDPEGLTDSYTTSLCIDKKGRFWIGTNSGGLNEMEIPTIGATPKFRHYGVKDGLPSATVMSILEGNDGQLWISTAQKLCRFDPDVGKGHPFIWHEDLQQASFSRNAMFKAPDGTLFYGGSNGFTVFRPDDIVFNDYVAPVAITDFKLLNQSANLIDRLTPDSALASKDKAEKPIILSHNDYEFSFEFATMHFVAPEQNQYAYMMEGLDQDWNYSRNNHFIAYTTLPAGDYTFRVKASNCDGVWGEEGIGIKIRILPPWWKTWWFRTLMAVFGAFVILIAIRLRLRALRKSNQLLEIMVAEKTQETRDILDNIEQGLFTINLDGKVNSDYALSTNSILQVKNVAGLSIEELFRMDENQSQYWREWLDLIKTKHETMRWSILVNLAPVEVLTLRDAKGPRYIQIGYQRMFDRQKKLNKLMILAQDVTEAKRNERRIEEEKQLHEYKVKAILAIVQNAGTLPVFLEDMHSRLVAIESVIGGKPDSEASWTREQLDGMFREIHTIKGTAATYGFKNLTGAAVQSENILAEIRDRNTGVTSAVYARLAGALQKVRSAFEEIRELAGRIIGIGGSATAAIPLERIRRIQSLCEIISAVDAGAPDADGHAGADEKAKARKREEAVAELLQLCRSLDFVPLSTLTENYRHMLLRIGDRLNKRVELRVVPAAMEFSPKAFIHLNEPLVHLLRNAVDHGLETESERSRLGKPPTGVIELNVSNNGRGLVISVADDGAGIDVDKVAQKAAALGLIAPEKAQAMSESEKAELIFQAGLSTRGETTDISGRGVGMDVVADWTKASGGKVEVETKPGRGTKISLVLPKSLL